jgi:hypothetical protein
MGHKKNILQSKRIKPTELSAIQLDEMAAFYVMLLKYKKKRASFDVALVMKLVYKENVFAKFILNYSKTV